MKLLLTAFDPFGGEKINPALEAVKRVQDKIGDLEIVKLEVPTVFYKSIDTVTMKGIEFLEQNNKWSKVYKGIKEFREFLPI